MQINKGLLVVYLVLFLCSLFAIFFIGREVDEQTQDENLVIETNPMDGLDGFKKWLDIAWGVRLTYRIDYSRYEEIYDDRARLEQVKERIQPIILQNIDDRISALGVSDYSSYFQEIGDDDFLVVEIWWVEDIDAAKEIIWKTVEMEFKVRYEWENPQEQKNSRQIQAEEILTQLVRDETTFEEVRNDYQDNNYAYQTHTQVEEEDMPEYIQDNLDELVELWEGNVYNSLIESEEDEGWYIVWFEWEDNWNYSFQEFFVGFHPEWVIAEDPASDEILNAAFFNYASIDYSEAGERVVLINFDERWTQIFCNISTEQVGQQVAKFVGGEMVSAPTIREPICGGTAQISGGWADWFSEEEARNLADSLNEWAMPAPLILSHEEMVSPALGEEALQASLIAAGVGFALVFVFMISFYWFKMWVVSIFSLLSFLVLLLWLVKLLWYALSLSWIAAIILTIWLAVDANVLIFERVREEMNTWKWKVLSVKDWFTRSFSAIRDGNLTTWLIALLLFLIGTNVFRGFWTMMIVNIILILLVVVPLTRELLILFYQNEDYYLEDQEVVHA